MLISPLLSVLCIKSAFLPPTGCICRFLEWIASSRRHGQRWFWGRGAAISAWSCSSSSNISFNEKSTWSAQTSPISPHIVTYTQNGIAEHHQNVFICRLSHYQHFLNIILKSMYNFLNYFANSKQTDKHRQKHNLLRGDKYLIKNDQNGQGLYK